MKEPLPDMKKGEWPSWKTLMRIASVVFVMFLLMRYWGAIESAAKMVLIASAAILSGFCIAYLINIPMRFIESRLPRKKGKEPSRGLALILSLAFMVVVVGLVLVLVVPQFLECMITFAQGIPPLVESLQQGKGIATLLPSQVTDYLATVDWDDVSEKVFAWFQSGLANALPQVLSIAGILGTLGIGCIFAIWMLSDKENLAALGHRIVRTYLGKEADNRLVGATALLDDSFRRYIVGQTLEATILGSLITLGALLLGLPYATMVGPLIALLSFIPMIGAPLGAFIGAIMILSVSWQQALIFLVMFFVIQQIEANFIYARVVGKIVGLSGFWTLLGITVGGSLFGLAGAFVGVPLTAAIYTAIRKDMEVREVSGNSLNAKMQRAFEE